MSRRTTYIIGGAAVALGLILIVVSLAISGDDGGDGGSTTTPAGSGPTGEARKQPTEEGGDEGSGSQSEPGSLARRIARRERVAAPGLALDVIEDGSAPAQSRAPLERASADGQLDLGRLDGTPWVLHVWSSECAPCRADARLIETTWQRWGRRGVVFVGASEDSSPDAAARFARQYELTYPIVHDEGRKLARSYGVTTLPETFFISASGQIVGQVAGSPSVRQMELGAAAARSGRPFGSEQGGSGVPLG